MPGPPLITDFPYLHLGVIQWPKQEAEVLHPAEKHTVEFISKREIAVSENEGVTNQGKTR